jgi:two-component system sensor histidine kinase BaeS
MSTTAQPAPAPERRRGAGLNLRLFAAMGLVVVAGGATLLLVALLIAPQVFHAHLRMALGDIPPATQKHVDEAFTRAMLLSLGMAVAVALIAALTITWLVSRRIAGPVADLAAAAAGLAAGRQETQLAEPGLGPEFAALTEGFNSMAGRLAATERIRRRMLADLAHELRTPLASIEATVEAVADGVLPADDVIWATLNDQTQRLGRLVDDIAAVSQIEERSLNPDLQIVALGELAATAAADIRARYTAKGVTLTVRVDSATPTVEIDPQRIAEALTNLLDNALRHTPPGGYVTITTCPAREFGQDIARLAITDTGEGFLPTEAGHIFERFYRTDSARAHRDAGSGIGLTITQAIISAHHGTIRAHSNGLGNGARFDITLPAATGGSSATSPRRSTALPVHDQPTRSLDQ